MNARGRPGQGAAIRMLGRDGCHLCDEALAGLRTILADFPGATLELIDIESDDELHRRHLERIPVVEVDGREVCVTFFEEETVRAALDRP